MVPRRLAALGFTLLLIAAAPRPAATQAIPTPEEHFGYVMGAASSPAGTRSSST